MNIKLLLLDAASVPRKRAPSAGCPRQPSGAELNTWLGTWGAGPGPGALHGFSFATALLSESGKAASLFCADATDHCGLL